MHVMDRPKQVELILQELDQLPTLSPVAARLMALGSIDDVDLDEVVMVLETDPAMTTTVLGLCRRAHTGLGDKIQTVRHAVVMLGLEAVQSAVLGVHVYEFIRNETERIDEDQQIAGGRSIPVDRIGLWKHAVAVAVGAELLAGEYRVEIDVLPEQAFVAGLLHDIGKPVLELVLPRAYGKVLAVAESRQSASAPVERALLGLDHHTVGKRIAERWQLPDAIRDVIWMHTQPSTLLPEGPFKRLIELVTLAKQWCRRHHLGWSADFDEASDPDELAARFGLDPSCLHELLGELVERVADRCQLLGLDDQNGPELLIDSITMANRRLSRVNEALRTRAQQSDMQTRVLASICSFHAGRTPRESVAATLGRVAASAAELFDSSVLGAVLSPGPGEPWQLFRFGRQGRVEQSNLLEDASKDVWPDSGVPAWAGEALGHDVIVGALKSLRLTGDSGEATAALIYDCGPGALQLEAELLQPVQAAWSAAVTNAIESARGHRLREQLAEANRSLAEAQRALTERESLTRLGEMAAGAAHEMNNPLTVIRARSQMLAERLDQPGDQAIATAISGASEELSELITSLHLIAAPPDPHIELADPMLTVRQAVDMARSRLEERNVRAHVILRASDHVSPLEHDRELLAQSLCEIIVNAGEAAPGENVVVAVQTDPADGRLNVRITDVGPGLSPRALRHAFDPFFSEKPAGRQKGLGLARARRLIELLGGQIKLANTPVRGAVATVTLDPEFSAHAGYRAA